MFSKILSEAKVWRYLHSKVFGIENYNIYVLENLLYLKLCTEYLFQLVFFCNSWVKINPVKWLSGMVWPTQVTKISMILPLNFATVFMGTIRLCNKIFDIQINISWNHFDHSYNKSYNWLDRSFIKLEHQNFIQSFVLSKR